MNAETLKRDVLLYLRTRPGAQCWGIAYSMGSPDRKTYTAVRRALQALKKEKLVKSKVIGTGSVGAPPALWSITTKGRKQCN
jgi:predicted ArsR family transcriptional regulator